VLESVLSLRCEDVSSSELFCDAYMRVPKMALTDGRYVPSFILGCFRVSLLCNRSAVLHVLGAVCLSHNCTSSTFVCPLSSLYSFVPQIKWVCVRYYQAPYIFQLYSIFLKLIDRILGNMFAEYNQQTATFHNLFISVRRSTCFRRVFRPIIRSSKLHIQRQTNTATCC